MNDVSIVVIAESSLTDINISDLLKWVLVKLYTINEYIIIIVSMLSSLIMVTDINYTKFPIFRFGRNKIYTVLFIIFIIFLFVGILNKQYHIVMLFFVSYYIISGIIKSIIRKINGEI